MTKLRDYFESDLDTFINTDEFAEEHNIDGKIVKCVVDSDALTELQLKNGGEGLANCRILFHVKKSELGFKPFIDQDIIFDDELYYINDVNPDEGIYTITLGVARS